MAAVIESVLTWCWKWSGCPLVVLVAVLALLWQTAYLDRMIDTPNSRYGARSGAKFIFGKRYWGYTHVINPKCFVHIETNEGVEIRVMKPDDLGNQPIVAIDEDRKRHRGIWAPVERIYIFNQITDHYEPRADGVWETQMTAVYPPEYFLRALSAVAPVYRQTKPDYDSFIYRAMQSGQLEYSEPIYAGYAHNALAIFMLGMTGRGLFGTRRWVRALRGLFRSKKNRCVVCGYDLRGLTRGRCPECGVLIPDPHAEIYTEREQIPGIESGVFAADPDRGGGRDQPNQHADGAGGDEPQAGR